MSVNRYQALAGFVPPKQSMEDRLDRQEEEIRNRAKKREWGARSCQIVCAPILCPFIVLFELIGDCNGQRSYICATEPGPEKITVVSLHDQCGTALSCWKMRQPRYEYFSQEELEAIKINRLIRRMLPIFDALNRNRDLFKLIDSYLE